MSRRSLLVGEVDNQVVAQFRQLERDAAPDAARRASDERDGIHAGRIVTPGADQKTFSSRFAKSDFPQVQEISYSANFLATMLALCPPKPKELLIAALTGISRAVPGT